MRPPECACWGAGQPTEITPLGYRIQCRQKTLAAAWGKPTHPARGSTPQEKRHGHAQARGNDQPTHPAPGASSASARPETGPADLLHHAPHPLFSQSDTRLAFTRRSSIIAAEASSAPASMRPRRRYAAIPLSLDKTADTARAPAPETAPDGGAPSLVRDGHCPAPLQPLHGGHVRRNIR